MFIIGILYGSICFKFVSDARNGPARGWRFCEFTCEPALHFSGVFGLPIAFQDKLSLFQTKLISCHGFSNSGHFAKNFAKNSGYLQHKKRVSKFIMVINLNICEHDSSITFISCI